VANDPSCSRHIEALLAGAPVAGVLGFLAGLLESGGLAQAAARYNAAALLCCREPAAFVVEGGKGSWVESGIFIEHVSLFPLSGMWGWKCSTDSAAVGGRGVVGTLLCSRVDAARQHKPETSKGGAFGGCSGRVDVGRQRVKKERQGPALRK
jgi:hypothetical protein